MTKPQKFSARFPDDLLDLLTMFSGSQYRGHIPALDSAGSPKTQTEAAARLIALGAIYTARHNEKCPLDVASYSTSVAAGSPATGNERVEVFHLHDLNTDQILDIALQWYAHLEGATFTRAIQTENGYRIEISDREIYRAWRAELARLYPVLFCPRVIRDGEYAVNLTTGQREFVGPLEDAGGAS